MYAFEGRYCRKYHCTELWTLCLQVFPSDLFIIRHIVSDSFLFCLRCFWGWWKICKTVIPVWISMLTGYLWLNFCIKQDCAIIFVGHLPVDCHCSAFQNKGRYLCASIPIQNSEHNACWSLCLLPVSVFLVFSLHGIWLQICFNFLFKMLLRMKKKLWKS